MAKQRALMFEKAIMFTFPEELVCKVSICHMWTRRITAHHVNSTK